MVARLMGFLQRLLDRALLLVILLVLTAAPLLLVFRLLDCVLRGGS